MRLLPMIDTHTSDICFVENDHERSFFTATKASPQKIQEYDL
jgi:hypothetical protein